MSKTTLIDSMVDDFLRWPLPDSVCADGCATKQGPGRIGTNLLTAIEAKEMFRAVVLPKIPAPEDRDRNLMLSITRGGHRLSLDTRDGHFRVNCNGATRASFNAACTSEPNALADAVHYLQRLEEEALKYPVLTT
jgi:hypothetical protein